MSEGYLVGSELVVTDGPLKDYQGKVMKIDRHKRTAVLELEFLGRKTKVTVGLEVVRKVNKQKLLSVDRKICFKRECEEEKMNYIIFGGSGFIGTHLIHLLKDECLKPGDKYTIWILLCLEKKVLYLESQKNEGVEYIRLDVRQAIEFDFEPTKDDIIFNLAAVHRTPGHPDHAYFETNIRGAENVTAFAEKHNIKKILFTSSIAPYGAAEELKTEKTLPTPNTPYGISKLVAEKIHQMWQVKDEKRELTIVRPGIVYGKGEHGNMTRLYKGQKKDISSMPEERIQ